MSTPGTVNNGMKKTPDCVGERLKNMYQRSLYTSIMTVSTGLAIFTHAVPDDYLTFSPFYTNLITCFTDNKKTSIYARILNLHPIYNAKQ
ncbi:hypothetical protein [Enterobacter ludwigii]|uniref:hypothetical protein n=1 Tax=Enterobacter ludwigii TaxID=299767 RepID=UPI003F706410